MDIPDFKFALREGLDSRFLPTRAHNADTGWDVRCAVLGDIVLQPYQHAKIKVGFRMFAPKGWWLELRPRSSTFGKKKINSLYGVLDETWEGESMMAVQWCPEPFEYSESSVPVIFPDTITIEYGDRIGQLVPVPRRDMSVTPITNEEFETLCAERNAERGAGGFGSTGT